MQVFHRTEIEKDILTPGTFVTRSKKDAQKFGYRRAVQNDAEYVYVYAAYVPEFDLAKDPNRDRSYILNVTLKAFLIEKFKTYDIPHKLKNFKMNTIS
jgi:hypothetical protein